MWFFGGSAKRKEIFLEIASSRRMTTEQLLLNLLTETDTTEQLSVSAEAIKEGAKKKTMPKFCATRWTGRISTLSVLLSKYHQSTRDNQKL